MLKAFNWHIPDYKQDPHPADYKIANHKTVPDFFFMEN